MTVHSTYVPPAGASDSLGWTCNQPGRMLDDPVRPAVAADTTGDAQDVGTGAADHLE